MTSVGGFKVGCPADCPVLDPNWLVQCAFVKKYDSLELLAADSILAQVTFSPIEAVPTVESVTLTLR